VATEPAQSVDEVLLAREAAGLKVPVGARVALSFMALWAVLYASTGAQASTSDAVHVLIPVVITAAVGLLVINVYFLTLLRRRRHVHAVGLGGALIDSAFIWLQVLGLYGVSQDPSAGMTLVYLFKSDVPLVFAAIVTVNGLALRPRYPLIVTVAATSALGFGAIGAALDPRTVMTSDFEQITGGGAIEAPQLVTMVLLLLGIGVSVTFITFVARRTIREAITRQLENARLQQEQLELVMREKVEALARLVAGVSHEVNSPLGAIRSGLDTQDKALEKVAACLPTDAENKVASRGARALEVARNTLESMRTATQRIAKTEASLRGFARVDQGDVSAFALHDELKNVISLISAEVRGDAELVEDYGADLPDLHGDAAAINQLFMTLLQNAFEAVDGHGQVVIRTRLSDGTIVTTISDDGRGMDDQTQRTLFDVALRSRAGRVAAGFGLPAAQSIARRHAGDIAVESQPGEGTTFTVTLPLGIPTS
jgi:signal transduction histidine kinase